MVPGDFCRDEEEVREHYGSGLDALRSRRQLVALYTYTIIAILVLAIAGLTLRFLKPQHRSESITAEQSPFAAFGTLTDSLLVPVIKLEVKDRALEKNWIAALADKLHGRAEVIVPYGRVDVVTGTYAIEVDYLHKFKEGIGQALHYGQVKGITPGLALIYERTESETDADVIDKLSHIESLCAAKGIRLFILMQE